MLFREDEADEYRVLKRELENYAKNCRVLTFKLKKAEKSAQEIQVEKQQLEQQIKQMAGGGGSASANGCKGGRKTLGKVYFIRYGMCRFNWQFNPS